MHEGRQEMQKTLMLAVVLTVCSVLTGGGVLAGGGSDYVTNYKEIVKDADWKKMKTVTVTLGEYEYSPSEVVFKAGQPYKLELINRGKKKHYYTAPEFFKAIATRKVQSNTDGEVKAPYFTDLEMMAEGGQLDLYFVPVKKGTYEVWCPIEDHRDLGSEGTITIE